METAWPSWREAFLIPQRLTLALVVLIEERRRRVREERERVEREEREERERRERRQREQESLPRR